MWKSMLLGLGMQLLLGVIHAENTVAAVAPHRAVLSAGVQRTAATLTPWRPWGTCTPMGEASSPPMEPL